MSVLKLIMVCVALCCSNTVFAQGLQLSPEEQAHHIDSLLNAGDKKVAIRASIRLSRSLAGNDVTLADTYAQLAIREARSIQDDSLLGRAYFVAGVVTYFLGDYGKTLFYQLKADSIGRKNEDVHTQSRAMNLIGLVYGAWQEDSLALYYYHQSERLSLQLADSSYLPNVLFNKAISLKNLKQYDEALSIFHRLLADAQRKQHAVELTRAHYMLAESYYLLQNMDKAWHHNQQALAHVDMNNLWDLGFIYGGLAQTALAMNQSDIALSYALQGIALQEQLGARWELQRLYKIASSAYEKHGQFKKALEFMKLHDAYKDSVFNTRQKEAIARMGIQQKQLENDYLTARTAQSEQQVKLQRNWILALSGLMLCTVALLFFLLKAKNNNDTLLSFKNQLLAIIGHDMNNMMHPLHGFVEMLNSKDITYEEFLEITPMLLDNITRLQLTFSNLLHWAITQENNFASSPKPLRVQSVFHELETLFTTSARRTGIHLRFNIEQDFTILFDEAQLMVVLRNVLHNALKFTPNNGHIQVYARKNPSDNTVCIGVKDSGMGMDAATVARILQRTNVRTSTRGYRKEGGTGLGLITTKMMLKANHSALHLQSKPKEGSDFYFYCPLVNH